MKIDNRHSKTSSSFAQIFRTEISSRERLIGKTKTYVELIIFTKHCIKSEAKTNTLMSLA